MRPGCGGGAAGTAGAGAVEAQYEEFVLGTYARPAGLVLERGAGCRLWDAAGREYLDFAAGIAVNCLGHSDPGWVEVVRRQAGELVHVSNLYHTPPVGRLAEALVRGCGGWASQAFFCNSGAEANEGAVKFCRRAARAEWEAAGSPGGRPRAGQVVGGPPTEVVAFSGGFHGRTMGALALTWKENYRAPFAPVMPGVRFAQWGDLESARAAVVPGRTCAVVVEPVQGEGGCVAAETDFLQGLRALCDEAGAFLMFDEVQCGLGRTGTLFAHQAYGVEPDVMTLAKPLAAGLPIGSVLLAERVARAVQPGDHGSTFAAGPLVCAAAEYTLGRIDDPALLANVGERGAQLQAGLRAALEGHPRVREVRGRGLLVGVHCTEPVGPLVEAARARGLLVIPAGEGDVLRMVPPLVVSEAEVAEAVGTLRECFQEWR